MENKISFSDKRQKKTYSAMLHLSIAFLLCILFIGGMVWHTDSAAIAAPIAPHPNTEIVLGVNYDGTAPWMADPTYAVNTDGQHTPGADENGNNNVVRTFDLISYRVDWNVNEVDATGTIITLTLPATIPEVVWKEVPAGCDLATSAISNNDQTLTCGLGDQREGSAGTLNALAEVASTRVGIDGDVILLDATIRTDQSPPVTSNPISTTISAAPIMDWVKIEPRVYPNVTRVSDNELGRIFTFPIYLAPENGERGSEPLDDTVAIQFFDHLYDWTHNTGVLPGEVITDAAAYSGDFDNRVCGAYSGDGSEIVEVDGAGIPFAMPYGVNGLGDANQTASGAATISCSDATGSSTYPIVQLDITGHDTTFVPPLAANGNTNSAGVVIAVQVPFFVPESYLFPGGVAATAYIHNAITGDSTTLIPDAITTTAPNSVTVAINVAGTATGLETTTANNAVATQAAFATTGLLSGSRYAHWVRFQRGPYQEHRIPIGETEMYFAGYDQRIQAVGGMGRNGLYADDPLLTGWDFTGPVSRDQLVILMLAVSGAHPNVDYLDANRQAIHGCLYIDTEHMELVDFPSAFAVNLVDGTSLASGVPLGATTGSPSDGLFHLNYGDSVTSIGHRVTDIVGVRINPSFTPDYVIEVATAATPFSGAYADGAVQCDADDADGNGWTAITTGSNLAPFDSDNNGTYDLIDMVRVRTLDPVPWLPPFRSPTDSSGLNLSNHKAGAQFHFFAQAQVKATVAEAANGDDIHIHASRARGEWPLTSPAPTVPLSSFDCTNYSAGLPAGWNDNPTGWCGLGTAQAVEKTLNGVVQLAHMDRLVVTGPQLNVNKENVAGLTQVVGNGDLVTFSIDVGVTGGVDPADEMTNIVLTDTLEAHYSFVSLQQPASGTCSGTNTITCTFGNRTAPWTDSFTITVRVQNAGANQPLTNTVTASGANGGVTSTVSDAAYAYTPDAYHQLELRKEVLDLNGNCTRPPGVTAHVVGDCSTIEMDGVMTFTIHYTNIGSTALENLHLIDVVPHVGDTVEPQTDFASNSGIPPSGITGDGRTPPSAFSGTISLASATDSNGFAVQHTVDPVATVDRNPATNSNTWLAGTATGATGIKLEVPQLTPGMTGTVTLVYNTLGNVTDDIYTSNFGAQAFGSSPVARALGAGGSGAIYVGNRSNDVSVMVLDSAPSLDLSKTLSSAEPVTVGQPVVFTIRITNTGNVTITTLPLMDTYDTNYLSYNSIVGSTPATDNNASDGQLDWSDLTLTEGDLGPDEVIEVVVNFTAAADTSDIATAQAPCTNAGESCNVATVNGAMADTEPVPPVTDSDDVEIEELITGKSTLGDFVWFDTNSDGIKDPGEPGINGVIINLYDSTGFVTTTVTMSDTNGIGDDTGVTNGDGFYDFQVLPSTVYTVEIDPSNFAPGGALEGYTYTGNNAAMPYNGDETRVVGMPAVQHDENDVDFSYVTHSLGNYVWLDADNSGDVTAGEQPVPDGVVMELLNNSGTVVMSTTTTSGYYLFTGLAAGDYQVRVAASNFQPSGLLENHSDSTGPAQEADPDSDGDQNDNGLDGGVLATDGIVSAMVTVGGTEPTGESATTSGIAGDDGAGTPDVNSNLTVDFGILPPLGSIGDTIWGDMDQDGDSVLDGTDVPLAGVVVELEMPDGSTITTTTNVSGTYLFPDLPYGTYTVTVDTSTLPAGYLTTPTYDPDNDGDSTATVTLDSTTPNNLDQDFSYPPDVQPVLIGDRVWIEDDNDGLATTGVITPVVGTVVTAVASDGTVYTNTTDAMGYYTITVPANDVYTVTAGTPAGTVVAIPSGGLVTTDNDPTSDNDTSHDPAGTVVTVGTVDNLTIDFGFYEPMMAFELSKTVNTPMPARVGERISFTIRITNTGTTVMTQVPLTDTYDNAYISYTGVASPIPDSPNPGELVWSDLTSSGTSGFGVDLNPGETFAVVVEFITNLDTTGLPNNSTVNVAASQGITDTAEVQAFSPTSVEFALREVAYENEQVVVRWQTADESDVVGFHIYRAVVGEGDNDPIKLTPEMLIAEKSGSPSGASYTYEDASAETSVDYRYFVGIVDVNGFETQEPLGNVLAQRTIDEWFVFLPIMMK